MNAVTVGMLIDSLRSHGWEIVEKNELPSSTAKFQLLRKGERVVSIAGRPNDEVSPRAASSIFQVASESDSGANA